MNSDSVRRLLSSVHSVCRGTHTAGLPRGGKGGGLVGPGRGGGWAPPTLSSALGGRPGPRSPLTGSWVAKWGGGPVAMPLAPVGLAAAKQLPEEGQVGLAQDAASPR